LLRVCTRHELISQQMKQELQSQKLELAYEKSTRGIDVTCEAEKLRQMRVKAMLCEDVNDDLQDQLAQDDTRFDELQNTQEELQNQLEVSTKDFERVRADLRLRDREIESLKVRPLLHGSVSCSRFRRPSLDRFKESR
jgi:benzoyl-CoA reductase/2-hydroxyglutaryl-CoA dehydratase subunit BcrC/BadD/HgdB